MMTNVRTKIYLSMEIKLKKILSLAKVKYQTKSTMIKTEEDPFACKGEVSDEEYDD